MTCALRDRECTFENNLKILYFSTDNFLECHDILTEIKPKSCKNTFCQFLSKSGLKTNDIFSLLHCKNIEMTRKTMLLLRDIL